MRLIDGIGYDLWSMSGPNAEVNDDASQNMVLRRCNMHFLGLL